VISLEEPQTRPFICSLGSLVYNGRGSDVEITIIYGKLVYEEGCSMMVDQFFVKEDVQAMADELFDRLGINSFRTRW
jgi:hypothetical protein